MAGVCLLRSDAYVYVYAYQSHDGDSSKGNLNFVRMLRCIRFTDKSLTNPVFMAPRKGKVDKYVRELL